MKNPVFYIKDVNYIFLVIIAGLISFSLPKLIRKAYTIFRLVDSVWLAIFVIIWTNIGLIYFLEGAENYGIIKVWTISIMLWMITGFWWWIVRDTIIWETPYAFKKNANYVTAAFLGSTVYFILVHVNVIFWIVVSFALTMIYREVVSPYGIVHKLYFKK